MASNTNTAQDKAAGAAKASIDRTVEHGSRVADTTREGFDTMADLQEKTTESARQIMQTSLEAASRQAQEMGERLTRNFGIGEDGQRLADQSRQNMEAVARCGTVLTQAFQDASREWIELSQRQWRRGFDGLQRLARVRTAHEMVAVQSDLVRENLQEFVQDGRGIAERSMRAADEAGKAFATISAGRRN